MLTLPIFFGIKLIKMCLIGSNVSNFENSYQVLNHSSLLCRYTTTKVPSERSLLLRALAQTRDLIATFFIKFK